MKFQIVTEIELTHDEFELLQKINTCGYAEYRDTEWETLEDFIKHKSETNWSQEDYLYRNFDGSFHIASRLEEVGLLFNDPDSWHLTYLVSELGKQLLAQNK